MNDECNVTIPTNATLALRLRWYGASLDTWRWWRPALALACAVVAAFTLTALAPRPAGAPRATLEPVYRRERGPLGTYRWSAPSGTLEATLPEPAKVALVVHRLSAGPRPRPLTIRAGVLTTTFTVASGVAPRVYRYLLPASGRFVYGRLDVPPLRGAGDARTLGLAVFGTAVRPLVAATPPGVFVAAASAALAAFTLALGWRGLALSALALALYGRIPALLHEPRLWAEEGNRYFAYAYAFPWWGALTHPQLGYYALVPNAATLAARLAPLRNAPLITTFVAGVVQLLPFAVVLWGSGPLWSRPRTKVAACLLLLLAPLTAELWLTTITSQFHLLLTACLVLIDDDATATRLGRWAFGGVVLLAGLSGPLPCLLAPLFFWKAWRTRSRATWVYGALLAACGGVQFAALSASARQRASLSLLDRLDAPWLLAVMATKTLLPILGADATQPLADRLWARAQHAQQHVAFWSLLALGTAALAWLLICAAHPQLRLPLAASYVLLAAAALLLGTLPNRESLFVAEIGYRYFYVPNVLALLLVFSAALRQRARRWPVAAACGLLLALVTLRSLWSYRNAVAQPSGQPEWALEVARWQASPEEPLHIWPAGWTMELKR